MLGFFVDNLIQDMKAQQESNAGWEVRRVSSQQLISQYASLES